MRPYIFYQLGGRRRTLYGLSVHHNGSSLSSGDIELEGSQMSLVLMKRTYIGTCIEAGMDNISKSPTI
jgi:hypothetical protein